MKCRSDSDKHAFFDGQTAKYSALDFFLSFIVAVQRSCKCICYASEKRADCPAKRQTNAA